MLRYSLVLGVWCLGFRVLVERVYRCRIHVSRCRNRARTTIAHICEQERLAADKHIEVRTGLAASPCKRVEKSFGVIPITRAVFHPSDCTWISFHETFHQIWCDPDGRHRRYMIKINSQTGVADALHDFAEVTVETFFGNVPIIKRRQHQHTGATMSHRMRC